MVDEDEGMVGDDGGKRLAACASKSELIGDDVVGLDKEVDVGVGKYGKTASLNTTCLET